MSFVYQFRFGFYKNRTKKPRPLKFLSFHLLPRYEATHLGLITRQTNPLPHANNSTLDLQKPILCLIPISIVGDASAAINASVWVAR